LSKAGVQTGERVAAVVTNSVEALVLLLATGWLGAIFTSIAPDMGAGGIVERFLQVQPKVLFLESSVLYAGKQLDLRPKFIDAIEQLKKASGKLQTVVDVSSQPWPESVV
jgi:acetoacetyl-CoA synthetase